MKWLLLVLSFFPSLMPAQEPTIKGGLDSFVQNSTVYPAYAKHNCIEGNIKVSFKLNAKGEVRDAVVTSGLGIDLDEEALRLIKLSSGKWIIPANFDTDVVIVVPVNFKLQGYNCEGKTKAEIAKAIQAYKDEEELIDAVSNYYKNKEKGIAKPEDEARVIRIKNELGIDDAYLDQRLESGLKKYKQGDQQGACKEFNFVKYMGSDKANHYLSEYCN